jgi:hypothetical protein
MSDTNLNFIKILHQEIMEAMQDASSEEVDPQYRLGIRRLAKSFFDTFDLFEMRRVLPELEERDVDAWYAGREHHKG